MIEKTLNRHLMPYTVMQRIHSTQDQSRANKNSSLKIGKGKGQVGPYTSSNMHLDASTITTKSYQHFHAMATKTQKPSTVLRINLLVKGGVWILGLGSGGAGFDDL